MAGYNFSVDRNNGSASVAAGRREQAMEELKGLVEKRAYNLGELILNDKGKLEVINNHKSTFFSNDTKTTSADNRRVRRAIAELISLTCSNLNDGKPPLYYDAIYKRLTDAEYSSQPLTRREVCGYLKLLSKTKLDDNENRIVEGLKEEKVKSAKILACIKGEAPVDVGDDPALRDKVNRVVELKGRIGALSGEIGELTTEFDSISGDEDPENQLDIETRLAGLREELANAQEELKNLEASLSGTIYRAGELKGRIGALPGEIAALTTELNQLPGNDLGRRLGIETRLAGLREELASAQEELKQLEDFHARNVAYCEQTIKDYSEKPVDDLFRNEHGIGTREGRTQRGLSKEDISGITRSDNVILASVRAGNVSVFKEGLKDAEAKRENLKKLLQEEIAKAKNRFGDKIDGCRQRSFTLKGDLAKVSRELVNLTKKTGKLSSAEQDVVDAENDLRDLRDVQCVLKHLAAKMKGCVLLVGDGTQGELYYVKDGDTTYRVLPPWQRGKKENFEELEKKEKGSGYKKLEENELALDFKEGKPYVKVPVKGAKKGQVEYREQPVMFSYGAELDGLLNKNAVQSLFPKEADQKRVEGKNILDTVRLRIRSNGEESLDTLLDVIKGEIDNKETELDALKAKLKPNPKGELGGVLPGAAKNDPPPSPREEFRRSVLTVIGGQISGLEGEDGEIALLERNKKDLDALRQAFGSKMGTDAKKAVAALFAAYGDAIEKLKNHLASLKEWKIAFENAKDDSEVDLPQLAEDLKTSISQRIDGLDGKLSEEGKKLANGLYDCLKECKEAIENDLDKLREQSAEIEEEMPESAMDVLVDRLVGGLIDRERELGGGMFDVVHVGIIAVEQKKPHPISIAKSFAGFGAYVEYVMLHNRAHLRTFDAQIDAIAHTTGQEVREVRKSIEDRLATVIKHEMEVVKNGMRGTLQTWINRGGKPADVEGAIEEISEKINERMEGLYRLFTNAKSHERTDFLNNFIPGYSAQVVNRRHNIVIESNDDNAPNNNNIVNVNDNAPNNDNIVNVNSTGKAREKFNTVQNETREVESQLNQALGLKKGEKQVSVKNGGGSLPGEDFFNELADLKKDPKKEKLQKFVDDYNARNSKPVDEKDPAKGRVLTISTGKLNTRKKLGDLTVDVLQLALDDDYLDETRKGFGKIRMTVEMMGVDWKWLEPRLDFAIGIFVSPTAMLKTALVKINDEIMAEQVAIETQLARLKDGRDAEGRNVDDVVSQYADIRKRLLALNKTMSARRAMYNRMITVLNYIQEVNPAPRRSEGEEPQGGQEEKTGLKAIVEQFGVITSQMPKEAKEAGFFSNLFLKKESKADNNFYGQSMRERTGSHIVGSLSASYMKFAKAQFSALSTGIGTLIPVSALKVEENGNGKYKPVADELNTLFRDFNDQIGNDPDIKGKVDEVTHEDRTWIDTWEKRGYWTQYTRNASYFVAMQFTTGIEGNAFTFNGNQVDVSREELGRIAFNSTYADISY